MSTLFESLHELSHTLHPDVPTWDGSCGFALEQSLDYGDCQGEDKFRVQHVRARAGIGTHMDAPAHCFSGAATIDLLPVKSLVVPCAILRSEGEPSAGTVIGIPELQRYERRFGRIEAGSFVLASSGWSVHWPDPERYRNDLRFPSVSAELAAELLKREISGLGIDTLSADAGGKDFPVHRLVLGAGKYLVENVATSPTLPECGGTAIILPPKIGQGTEAPVRMLLAT